MKSLREQNVQDLVVFTLLVAIGVAGRWGQPQWCFTPIAACALLAGLYFSRLGIALMVPVATLAISDLLLPAYNSIPVLLSTYTIMSVPVGLGRLQRGESSRLRAVAKWAVFGLVPATLFFIVTNFAVWAFQSDYPGTLAGLAECYWKAVPFFRWMLVGDFTYLAILLGCMAIANAPRWEAQPAQESAT